MIEERSRNDRVMIEEEETVFDEDDVVEVLLADGWHAVKDESFKVVSYAWRLNDANVDGFEFNKSVGGVVGARVVGPLTSVLAVKHRVR